VSPRTTTVDKNPAYPKAATEMKTDGELWRCSRLRQVKYLNSFAEQDHRRINRLIRPGLGFGRLLDGSTNTGGYEAMAMIRKGQVRHIVEGKSELKPPSSSKCSTLPPDLTSPVSLKLAAGQQPTLQQDRIKHLTSFAKVNNLHPLYA
jgi:hypothetical protein